MQTMPESTQSFSSELPVIVYTRPANQPNLDWQELDRGPGVFHIPFGHEVAVRIKTIDNEQLGQLVQDLKELRSLRFLNLSENRNITNEGAQHLRQLPQLTALNLSSCSITNPGLEPLRDLPKLEWLDISYCNRLSDPALKTLEVMRSLTWVDMQGCSGVSNGGFARVKRKTLKFHR